MADVDAKGIGLAAKDIVVGLGTVVAGASMGPAGAEGVSRAGGALDKILKMAGVTEESTRAPVGAAPGLQAEKRESASAVPGRATAPGTAAARATTAPWSAAELSPSAAVLGGDAQTAAEHLQRLGWSREAALRIVRGPERSPEHDRNPESGGNPSAAHARSMVVERAGYAPDVRFYDADALMLRGVGITTERLEPHEEV